MHGKGMRTTMGMGPGKGCGFFFLFYLSPHTHLQQKNGFVKTHKGKNMDKSL